MNLNSKLSIAIAAILSSAATSWVYAAPAPAEDTESEGIQEITVTAQRRSESIQNVPISIQALSAETLTQLNVTTIDDFVKYLPNVTAPSNGPGQGNIYMRGLSSGGSAGSQSSGSIGLYPNVAIYLDDQSGQLPGRNLDIYAADLERIEVLEGPQGTLFGAGAEAGVIRYITNKPKLNVTEGHVDAGYSATAHGANNSDVQAVLNVPIIDDHLAVRAVIYNEARGGYIDNVPGTFTRKNTDLGIYYGGYATACTVGVPSAAGTCPAGSKGTAFAVPPGSASINNNSIAKNDINPVTYSGIRGSVYYQANDDWNALLTQTYQNIHADGVFYQMPTSSDGQKLDPYQVTLFNDAYDKDKFENTALTVNGKVGPIKAVYTGAYLVRNVDQRSDYTNYARGVYADYYQCYGAHAGLPATCYSPSTSWREQERNTHMSHELRFSTPDDWRLRGLVGAFWEDLKIQDQTDWLYKTLPNCTTVGETGCMTDVGPAANSTLNNPDTRNDNTAFFEDVTRGYKQWAGFLSADFDLIPKVLTITGGTRYYTFMQDMRGTVVSSFGCFEKGIAPCTAGATSIDAEGLHENFHGFKSRGNVTYHVTPDVMVYFTYSQGYRPGGFNRSPGSYIPDQNGVKQFLRPLTYAPDDLTNKEIGWKTEFFGHKLQFNGAVYQENWNNVQVNFFDPGELGNLTFATNGPNYRVRGVEMSAIAAFIPGLTVTSAVSYNKSEQTNSPSLVVNNPASVNFGQPIVRADGTVINPYGAIGSPSAMSPLVQGNMRVRYEWKMNDYNLFSQIGGTYTSSSFTQSGSNPELSAGGGVNTTLLRFVNPAYASFDASVGVGKDQWTVQAYGQNLADKNVSVFTSTGQFVQAQTVLRPRILGVRFGYKF